MVLLVGPKVTRERACIESLRLRGYTVQTVPGEREAISAFDHCSPELILADVQLGRSEGIDLIQSIRQVPGIEEVPVILMDGHRRDERSQAARRIGAAGYLVYPIDIPRISERLRQIVAQPSRRRFTRYEQRVAVHMEGATAPLLTTAIGRGGMFLATEADLPENTVRNCRLALPDIDANVLVQGEVLYRARGGPSGSPGGSCFCIARHNTSLPRVFISSSSVGFCRNFLPAIKAKCEKLRACNFASLADATMYYSKSSHHFLEEN